MVKPRDYCCCAFPLVNFGIYAALLEQFTLGLVVGLLSLTTPSIVGASVFSGSAWILGIIALVGAGIQVLGFLAVKRGSMNLFKRYSSLHLLILLGGFAVAATWIVMSAIQHNTAEARCLNDFFRGATGSLQSQGRTLCNIFAYVDVGIMACLWVLFAITQIYLYVLMLSYPASLRSRTALPIAVNEKPVLEAFSMNKRNADAYPAEPRETSHLRQNSGDSLQDVQDVMNEPMQRSHDGYSQRSYDADSYYPSKPRKVWTEEPMPTPAYQNNYSAGPSSVNRPADAKYHPAEGSFGRKTPRMQQDNPYLNDTGNSSQQYS